MMNSVIRIASYMTIPALVLVLLLFVHEKKNYHMDEISSYIGANNAQDTAISLHPGLGVRYEDASSPWLSQMTVRKGHAFDYARVFEIQAADVHPPLYYALLHTVCSFFPGVFSKWFAGGINILFSVLTLITVRKMTAMMTESDAALLLVSGVYVISGGLISAATYFRMYVMLMFFFTWFAYLLMYGGDAEKEPAVRWYIASGLSALSAMLTQYYALFFLAGAFLAWAVMMIVRKRFRRAALLCVTMAVAAALFFLVFPASLTQMRSSTRGADTLRVFSGGFSDAGGRFGAALRILNEQLFGGIVWLLPAVAAIAAGLVSFRKKRAGESARRSAEVKGAHRGLLWLIPVSGMIVYVFLTSQTAPYLTPRYYYPVYALTLCVTSCVFYGIIQRAFKNRVAFLLSGCVLAVTGLFDFRGSVHYLYRSTQPFLDAASAYAETDCICIAKNMYDLNAAFLEVSGYNSVTFFSADDLSALGQSEPDLEQGLLLVIGEGCDTMSLERSVRDAFSLPGEPVLLGGHGGAQTFYYAGRE